MKYWQLMLLQTTCTLSCVLFTCTNVVLLYNESYEVHITGLLPDFYISTVEEMDEVRGERGCQARDRSLRVSTVLSVTPPAIFKET